MAAAPATAAAAAAGPGVVVMLRCCFHQFAARHSNDDNNGERGINEIIGTVWMITLHPSANVFPIPPWSLRNTPVQGLRLLPDHLSPEV